MDLQGWVVASPYHAHHLTYSEEAPYSKYPLQNHIGKLMMVSGIFPPLFATMAFTTVPVKIFTQRLGTSLWLPNHRARAPT